MKLVVGLGNPGRKYVGTRHNIGFNVLQRLADEYGTSRPRAKFDGELVEAEVSGERVMLLAPHTYMNRSGSSVVAARDFFKLENEAILIVCDDVSLPVGKIRFRPQGSSGGQKGLGDIIQRLGSQEIPRLRIGIGAAPENWDVKDYVLSKFRKEEQSEVDAVVRRAADGAGDWVRHGVQYCMNRYNAS